MSAIAKANDAIDVTEMGGEEPPPPPSPEQKKLPKFLNHNQGD